MRVAILGYGVEGQAAYRYWHRLGAEITVCDAKTELELPDGVEARLGVDYLKGLDGFDLLVRSPGIRPDLIKSDAPTTSVTREFMAKCPAPIVGVTGTKGKGTTSTLIAKMLEAAGKTVWLGGNIGTPALDFLESVKPTDHVVLELSSFQLIDTTQSPQVGVCLMIVPDHLDYHPDMDNYIQAKGNIFRFQNPEDTAVYNGMQPEVEQLAQLSPGHKIPYGKPEGGHLKAGAIWFGEQKICSISDVALLGQHNLDNVCAAVSATYGLIGELEPLARAIKGFKGLPHRLEVVGTIDGVRYINDSFAANPTAAAAAIKAIEGSKVAIIGGFDRGIDQSGLIKALKDGDVRHVLLIGQSAAKLAQVLVTAGQANFEEVEGDMDQIVGVASKAARPGETVLLSPGSPSFDMFKNFADRGNQFRAAVERLAQA